MQTKMEIEVSVAADTEVRSALICEMRNKIPIALKKCFPDLDAMLRKTV